VIAPHGGVLGKGRSGIPVDRSILTARSIEFETVLVAARTTPATDIKTVILVQEACRHLKPLGAWGRPPPYRRPAEHAG
jgi:catalase